MALTLGVTGMPRNHCVHAVTKGLRAVPGVKKMSVSLDAGRARMDRKAEARALTRAVAEERYKAREVAQQ